MIDEDQNTVVDENHECYQNQSKIFISSAPAVLLLFQHAAKNVFWH